jgi:hypothetical protein
MNLGFYTKTQTYINQNHLLPTHEPIAAYMGGIFELSKVLEFKWGLYYGICGPKQCFY